MLKKEPILIGDDWVADIEGITNFGIGVLFFNPNNIEKNTENIKIVKTLKEIEMFL